MSHRLEDPARQGQIEGSTVASTPQAILDAAELQFARTGYRNSRLTEITELAGLTTGALYRHFEGKEGLLEAMFHRFDAELMRRLESSRTIEEALTGWLDLADRRRGTMRAYDEVTQIGSEMAERIRLARAGWVGAMSSILPGASSARERRIYAELICDMIEQYALVERMGWVAHRPVSAVASEIAKLVRSGIRTP